MSAALLASGTGVRPAGPLWSGLMPAGQGPRLAAAIAAVVALHVGLLGFRPGASGAQQPAGVQPTVMAVRMLHAVAPSAALPIAPVMVMATVDAPPAAPLAVAVPKPALLPRPSSTAELSARGDGRADRPGVAAAPPSSADPASAPPRSLAAAPDYALGATLDPGPRPLDEIEPEYPDPYLREGVVVLRLLIAASGHVDDVAVVRAAPEGVFEQAALEAFAKARFAPGLSGGTPVKSQITVEVNFVPINRGSRVSGRTY
jgi:periplasmic protein TonB